MKVSDTWSPLTRTIEAVQDESHHIANDVLASTLPCARGGPMAIDRSMIGFVTKRTDAVTHRWVPHVLRWIAGLLWLSNVSWKIPPDFGRSGEECGGLCRYVEEGVTNPVLPGSSWLFEKVLTPNLFLVGWTTVLLETLLAALFISGRHLRVAAVLGVVQSLGIGLAVANADDEWYWSYGLMAALHLAVLATASQVERPPVRTSGLVMAGYGLVIAAAHAGAGLIGDENGSWSLFDQANDFPGDFGRNVFPGSILLGLLLVAFGAAVVVGAGRLPVERVRAMGWALLAGSVLALVFVAAPRVEGWLGVRSSTIAIVLVVAFAMISPRPARGASSGS